VAGAQLVVRDDSREVDVELAPLASAGVLSRRSREERRRA
jgi:hypothetical protein